MKNPSSIVALLLSVLASACASSPPSARIERMYAKLRAEVGDRKLGPAQDDIFWVHQSKRLESVRELAKENALTTPRDHLYAAVILVETDSDADLVLSRDLGLAAAEKGEPKGFRVAAEATDKLCVKQGVPQRFGTQYVYEPVIRAWRLYPYDPNTTDVERQAMGIEPMAKLKEREAELNTLTGGKPN